MRRTQPRRSDGSIRAGWRTGATRRGCAPQGSPCGDEKLWVGAIQPPIANPCITSSSSPFMSLGLSFPILQSAHRCSPSPSTLGGQLARARSAHTTDVARRRLKRPMSTEEQQMDPWMPPSAATQLGEGES